MRMLDISALGPKLRKGNREMFTKLIDLQQRMRVEKHVAIGCIVDGIPPKKIPLNLMCSN